MTKLKFMERLSAGLECLPVEQRKERLTFYSEMIDDYMEEGHTEEEAVEALGSVEDIVKQTLGELPPVRIDRKISANKLKTWEILLLVLGSPVWLSLLVAAVAVVLSGYIALWSVAFIAPWTVFVSLAASSVACPFAGVVFATQGYAPASVAAFCAMAVCAGLSIFTFWGSMEATRGCIWITRKLPTWAKALLLRREADHE